MCTIIQFPPKKKFNHADLVDHTIAMASLGVYFFLSVSIITLSAFSTPIMYGLEGK